MSLPIMAVCTLLLSLIFNLVYSSPCSEELASFLSSFDSFILSNFHVIFPILCTVVVLVIMYRLLTSFR